MTESISYFQLINFESNIDPVQSKLQFFGPMLLKGLTFQLQNMFRFVALHPYNY